MAENTETKTETKAKGDKEPEEPTYHIDRLLAESHEFLDQPAHVVAGALAAKDARKQNFTLSEAQKAIDAWLRKPVE